MDIDIDQRYYNRIKKMVKSPTVQLYLRLPEKVFLSFNFDKFVYIKHKVLTGYFYVQNIQDYKDGTVLVRADALYVD